MHPGGRSVLDAVERGSSSGRGRSMARARCCAATATCPRATVIFVLAAMLESGAAGPGCALAFGPGLAVETMLFEVLG